MKSIQAMLRILTLVIFAAVIPALPAAAQNGAILAAGGPFMFANPDTFSIRGSSGVSSGSNVRATLAFEG